VHDSKENSWSCLGIIPARGGSKQVPRKNIKAFAGSSLLEITVDVALRSRSISRLIVNTDSDEIETLASSIDPTLPVRRPDQLGEDATPVKDVVLWTVENFIAASGYTPDFVITLQPTSPFRTPELIDEAVALLTQNPEADSVVSVVLSEHSPYKMQILERGYLKGLMGKRNVLQRQDAPQTYRFTGNLFLTRTNFLLESQQLWGNSSIPLIETEKSGFNIDSELDFHVAELLYLETRL